MRGPFAGFDSRAGLMIFLTIDCLRAAQWGSLP